MGDNPGLNVVYQGGRDINVNSRPYTIPANVDLGSRDAVRSWVIRADDSNGFIGAYGGSGNNLATGSVSAALSQPGSLTASGADLASPLAAIRDPRGPSNTYIGFRTDAEGRPAAQGEVKYNSGSDGYVFVVNNSRYDIPDNVALVDGRVSPDSVRRWASSNADSGGFNAAGVPAKPSGVSQTPPTLNNLALIDPTGRPSFTGAASITNPAYVDSVLYPNGRPGSSPQNAIITAADPNSRSLETRYAGQAEAAARVVANEVGQTLPGLAWLGSAATTQVGRAANAVTGGNLPQIENLGRSGEQAAQNWSETARDFYMNPGVTYDSSGTPRQTVVPNYESNERALMTVRVLDLAATVYTAGASTARNAGRLGNTAQAFNLSDDVAIRAANTGQYYSNLPPTNVPTATLGGVDDAANASRATQPPNVPSATPSATPPQRLLPAAGQTSSPSTGRLANPTQVEVVRIPPDLDSARAPLNRDVAPRVAGSTDAPIRPASTPDAFRVTPETPIVVQPSNVPPRTNPFDNVELPINPDGTSQFVLESTNPRSGATTSRFVDLRPGNALTRVEVRRAAADVRLGNTHTYPDSGSNAPLLQAIRDSEVTARVYNLDPSVQFTIGEPAFAGARTNAYSANATRDPSSYIHSVISPSHPDLPRVPGGGSQATGIVVRAGDQTGLPPAVLVNTPLGTPVTLTDDAGAALASRTGVRVDNPGVAKLYEGLGFHIQTGTIDDSLSTAAGTFPRDQARFYGTSPRATGIPGYTLADDAAGAPGTFGGQPIHPLPTSGAGGTRLYIQPSTITPGTGTVVQGPGAPRLYDSPIGIDRQLPPIGGTSASPLTGRDLTRALSAAEKTDINNAVRSTFSSPSPVFDTGIGPDELTNAVRDTTRIVTEFGLTPKDAAYVARYGTRPDGTSLRPVIPDAPATVTPAAPLRDTIPQTTPIRSVPGQINLGPSNGSPFVFDDSRTFGPTVTPPERLRILNDRPLGTLPTFGDEFGTVNQSPVFQRLTDVLPPADGSLRLTPREAPLTMVERGRNTAEFVLNTAGQAAWNAPGRFAHMITPAPWLAPIENATSTVMGPVQTAFGAAAKAGGTFQNFVTSPTVTLPLATAASTTLAWQVETYDPANGRLVAGEPVSNYPEIRLLMNAPPDGRIFGLIRDINKPGDNYIGLVLRNGVSVGGGEGNLSFDPSVRPSTVGRVQIDGLSGQLNGLGDLIFTTLTGQDRIGGMRSDLARLSEATIGFNLGTKEYGFTANANTSFGQGVVNPPYTTVIPDRNQPILDPQQGTPGAAAAFSAAPLGFALAGGVRAGPIVGGFRGVYAPTAVLGTLNTNAGPAFKIGSFSSPAAAPIGPAFFTNPGWDEQSQREASSFIDNNLVLPINEWFSRPVQELLTPPPSSTPSNFTLPQVQGGRLEAVPLSTDASGTQYRVNWTGANGQSASFDTPRINGQLDASQFNPGSPLGDALRGRIQNASK